MKVKYIENTKQASLAGAEEVEETKLVWFLGKELTATDNLLMRGWCEDVLSIDQPQLRSQSTILSIRTICWSYNAPFCHCLRHVLNPFPETSRETDASIYGSGSQNFMGGFIHCPDLRYSQTEPLWQCSQPWLHNKII